MYDFSSQMRLCIKDPLNATNNVGRSTFNLYFLKVNLLFLVDNVPRLYHHLHELGMQSTLVNLD